MVVVDRDLFVRVWNERAEAMWGLRGYEAQARHFLDLDIGLPVDALRDVFRAVLGGDEDRVLSDAPARNRYGREVVAPSCAARCAGPAAACPVPSSSWRSWRTP